MRPSACGPPPSGRPSPGEAHKSITSKYLYNEDVFPVFKAHCGRCHVEGGVAPMSLMTYDEASPWAESLRIELLADTIPTWHPLKLTARELDLVLVWATGGAPRGKPENAPPPVTLATRVAGRHTRISSCRCRRPSRSRRRRRKRPTTSSCHWPRRRGAPCGRSICKPGTPAIVRSATLLLKSGSGAPRELGTWVPGQDQPVQLSAPLRVPAGASLVARILYKRTWKYEGQAMTDASTIGLYFAESATRRPTPR